MQSIIDWFHFVFCFFFSVTTRLMREEDCNILVNLSREEFREFRSLVIDMVLATDMSCHFQQIKAAKALLTVPELRQDVVYLMLNS